MSEYSEDCCFNEIRDQCQLHFRAGQCPCRCHADYPSRPPGTDRQTLLFVADDLRRTAEAHIKSAGIAGKRIERKHLNEIAKVLIDRAAYYEITARDGKAAP